MDLITPREPQTPGRDTAQRERAAVAHQAAFVSRDSELEIAVVSDCSRRRAVNEDAHSPLGGTSAVFIVADGVGGGAMASWASRELVRRLHATRVRRSEDHASILAALRLADP